MKKASIVMAFAAVCVFALALVGCGGNNASSSSAAGDSAQASAESTASAATDAASADASGIDSVIRVNTEGMGVVSYGIGNEEPQFDDDMPYQSLAVNLNEVGDQTLHIEARDYEEYEGWHFTKWTKDGADFSTEKRIDVTADGPCEYIAVFEMAEE